MLRRALEAPTRQIAANSNADGGVVVDRMRTDPVKVVRVALENAVSVAGTLLLAEATLTEVREKAPERTMPAEEP